MRRQTKEDIWLTTLLLPSSEISPRLMASLCLPHTELWHAHKQQFSIPKISLPAAGSYPLSASRDDAGKSSSVRLATWWARTCSNELGMDIGSDAEQFGMQYSSLAATGLSSLNSKLSLHHCRPIVGHYTCFHFIFLLLSPTLQNCKITGSCFLVFDSIFPLIFLSLPSSDSIQSHTLKKTLVPLFILQVAWYCHVLIYVFGLVPRTAREGDFDINCLSSDILIYWKRFAEGRFYIF